MNEMNGLCDLKVIIDTDPGTDDCHAITMFLKHAVQVKALTTVFGNGTLEMTSLNACRILKYLEMEHIPVYQGAYCALASSVDYQGTLDQGTIHGNDGLGNSDVIPRDVDKRPEQDMSAPYAIVDIVKKHPGEITLVAIGPLTNIAIALRLCPELPTLVKKFFIMGGCTVKGNITRWAEFNFHCDPLAANVVLKAFSRRTLVHCVPWETCFRCRIPFDKLVHMYEGKPDTRGKILLEQTTFTPGYYKRKRESPEDGYSFADTFVPLALLRPDAVLDSETHGLPAVNCSSEDPQYGLMKVQELGAEGGTGGIKIYKDFDMKLMLELYCSSMK